MIVKRPGVNRRTRAHRGVNGLVIALMVIGIVACSATPATPPAANSTSAVPALGETADTPASCASSTGAVNAEALVPGSARTSVAGLTASPGQVGESLWDIARFLATGVAAFLTRPVQPGRLGDG